MIFESKRLLELAGIKVSEGLLTESSCEKISEFSSNDGVTEDEKAEAPGNKEQANADEGQHVDLNEDEIRETIREELASLWSSGQVFGKRKEGAEGVTLGFAGIGFKK